MRITAAAASTMGKSYRVVGKARRRRVSTTKDIYKVEGAREREAADALGIDRAAHLCAEEQLSRE